jgi:hypothetical protein
MQQSRNATARNQKALFSSSEWLCWERACFTWRSTDGAIRINVSALCAGYHQGYLPLCRVCLVVCKYGLDFTAAVFLELFS